jgi:predicted HicB family RNase H-like nuclease
MTMTQRARDVKPRELYVTLNTRVELSTRELLEDAAAREGISLRAAVEQAIQAKWGSGSSSAPEEETS